MEEEKYYINKKKNLIRLVEHYNKYIHEMEKFKLSSDDFDIEETFCTPEVCKNCDGHCCKCCPCTFAPADLFNFNDLSYIKDVLDTGLVVIARSADTHKLVLRVRGNQDKDYVAIRYNNFMDFYPKEDNTCILLDKEKGCLLPSLYRPTEALLLYAKSEDYHKNMYDTYMLEHDYEPYQDILDKLYKEYFERKIPLEENEINEKALSLVKKLSK